MSKRLSVVSTTLIVAVFVSASAAYSRELTFDDRVKAQEAIERVYYTHQIGANSAFENAVQRSVVESKVDAYLRGSIALRRLWGFEMSAQALRTELNRIKEGTQMPDRLLEIYAALNNDEEVVLECFVRQTLVTRVIRARYASDPRIHGVRRSQAVALREALVSGSLDRWRDDGGRQVITLRKQDGDPVALHRHNTLRRCISTDAVPQFPEYRCQNFRNPHLSW